jgi:hypothetical protein
LLHLTGITINGSATMAVGKDGLQVVAYVGDTSGDGIYSPLDASLISRVATIFDTGFAAYPVLDPVYIGDLNNNGLVDSTDVTLLNRVIAGIAQPQVPLIPSGLPIPATGPDPDLSLLTALLDPSASTLIVPVNIDTARPAGSMGMMGATLALQFDPRYFSVAASDIQLGTLLASESNWHLTTAVNDTTGHIGIDLVSTTPLQSAAAGSLVIITLHPLAAPPQGVTVLSLATQANPTGQRVYTNSVSDAQGAFVLHILAPTSQLALVNAMADTTAFAAEPTSERTGLLPAVPSREADTKSLGVETLHWDLQLLLAQNNFLAGNLSPELTNSSKSTPDDVISVSLFDAPTRDNGRWLDYAIALNDPPPESELDRLIQILPTIQSD